MNKKIIEAKEEYVMKRNYLNMINCDTLTYEQHIALATLAGARHELHTHSERLFSQCYERTVVNEFDPSNEHNQSTQLEEVGLPELECILDQERIDFPSYADWDLVMDNSEREEYEERAEEDGYPDGYSLWLEVSGTFESWMELCEKQNSIVEEYLARIDAEHGTHYAPTGYARMRIWI